MPRLGDMLHVERQINTRIVVALTKFTESVTGDPDVIPRDREVGSAGGLDGLYRRLAPYNDAPYFPLVPAANALAGVVDNPESTVSRTDT